jgi:hypothetical protein
MDIRGILDFIFYASMACFCIAGFSILMLILGYFIDDANYKIHPGVSKIGFCKKAVEWCVIELGLPKSKLHPHIKLTYKKKGPHLGSYHSHENSILIHFNNKEHKSILEICNTIIHEYAHHLQTSSKKFDADYYKETNTVGYWNNRYEIEAREIARKYEKELFDFMVLHRIIIKENGKK